jgi:hypothetical protein
MKTNIEQMFSDLVAKDFDAAKEQFSYILTQKVADKLEDVKAEVGSSFMNQENVTEGVGRMLGHPDSERGKKNSAILRKSVVGKGQKSIKSTGYDGSGGPPTVRWQSVETGRYHDSEEDANNDKD